MARVLLPSDDSINFQRSLLTMYTPQSHNNLLEYYVGIMSFAQNEYCTARLTSKDGYDS